MSTSTEERVLDFFREYEKKHDRSPKLDEIVSNVSALNGRPSALYTIRSLIRTGQIHAVKPKGFMRRYSSEREGPDPKDQSVP